MERGCEVHFDTDNVNSRVIGSRYLISPNVRSTGRSAMRWLTVDLLQQVDIQPTKLREIANYHTTTIAN